MRKVVVDMSVSLDGIGAGPNPSAEHPMGAGGERLHTWMPFYDPEQEPTAGVPAASEVDARMVQAWFATAKGAVVQGKRTFEHLAPEAIELERIALVASPQATHLRFRVVAQGEPK